MQISVRTVASFAALLAGAVTGAAQAESVKLIYKRVSSQTVEFGSRIEATYVLDVADIDGDGDDDLAISAMVYPRSKSNPDKNKPASSFVVRNDTEAKALEVVDLGEAGKTRNTTAGVFYRDPADDTLFFVLGRNGELFAPGLGTNVPETTSVFRIDNANGEMQIEHVFSGEHQGLTASVDTCDIDHDGVTEILVNNYNDYEARIVRREMDGFAELQAKQWVFMLVNSGAHNSLNFDDVNGDGWCDMLAAYEVPNPKIMPNPGFYQSFVSINADGKIGKSPMTVPNPAFGKFHSGMEFRMAEIGGRKLLFLTSAEFTGFSADGWNKYMLQVFEYDGKALVEVTDDVLDKQLPIKYAGQSDIRFNDIDKDGDLDVYMASYSGAIAIYRNDGGKLRSEIIRKDDGTGTKAVAFLTNPARTCSDLVVVRSDGVMQKYGCR